MKDRPKKGTVQPRKPYLKPEVKQVRLKPEEAVLGGCKVATITGPNIGPGTFCNLPGPCSALTS